VILAIPVIEYHHAELVLLGVKNRVRACLRIIVACAALLFVLEVAFAHDVGPPCISRGVRVLNGDLREAMWTDRWPVSLVSVLCSSPSPYAGALLCRVLCLELGDLSFLSSLALLPSLPRLLLHA